MSQLLDYITTKIQGASFAFCRYITINDTGKNGSHQAGFLVPKAAGESIFGHPLERGENEKKRVCVTWHETLTTHSVFTYYGRKKNEIRLTNFGRDFPFFQEENVGDLLVLVRLDDENYCGVVLSEEEDIENFYSQFNLTPGVSNQLLTTPTASPEKRITQQLQRIAEGIQDFPSTQTMALLARESYNYVHRLTCDAHLTQRPDQVLMGWIHTEYLLFQNLEEKIYAPFLTQPFLNCQSVLDFAGTMLNRRKARAGKSLELHLATLFTAAHLRFESQVITEQGKRPDFIFPSGEAYHNLLFPTEQLVFLGAKTTCKDRWRQVLNEANRIPNKYLFTLQPGISRNQLQEMQSENLHLVIPQQNLPLFPPEHHSQLHTLSSFIQLVRNAQT